MAAWATVGTTSIADIANAANITSIFIVTLLQVRRETCWGQEASRRNLLLGLGCDDIAGRSTSVWAESAIDAPRRRTPFVGR